MSDSPDPKRSITLASHAPRPEPPLGKAFFRAMRSILFEERPNKEIDALPMAQLRLLWTVHFSPDGTMKDYSEKLQVSQSTATLLADKLVKRDMIERLSDAEDRRVVRLRLSDAGMQLMGEADERRITLQSMIWERLTPQERDVTLKILERLADEGERVREETGRQLPPMPECFTPSHSESDSADNAQAQPMMDFMARPVRGKSVAV